MRKYTLILGALVFIGVIALSIERGPHRFSQADCLLCHYTDSAGKVTLLRQDAMTLCVGCHNDLFKDGYMHPVDISPRRIRIPVDLPLSDDGLLTCNTCHNIHAVATTPFGTSSYLLRRHEQGRAFCTICHEDLVDNATAQHNTALSEAHFQSKYIVTSMSQEIDAMSKNCISCHDGTFGSLITVNVGSWEHEKQFMGPEIGSSHPIGIDYEEARMKQGRKTDLRPISMVDPRLLFFDGKVGCGTCHNPYSKKHKQLVLSNQDSNLCLSCHTIDR